MNPESHIMTMAHAEVRNYVIPGLSSFLIGGEQHGKVRLFQCSRHHHESIIPHSHRFDFACPVLEGAVRNVLWKIDKRGDQYEVSRLWKDGEGPGRNYHRRSDVEREYGVYFSFEKTYKPGEWYSMAASEIHSIYFSAGARVLFFEGPELREFSEYLEPVVGGRTVPTFEVKNWMFERT